MKKYLVLALVALMFAAAGPAMAQSAAPSAQPIPDTWVRIPQALGSVVYDNGTTDPITDSGNEMSEWVQADDFELVADGTLTGAEVDWFDLNVNGWDGGIMWYIFVDAGGTPGPVLDSGNGIEVLTTLVSNANGWDWFITEFDFDHTTVNLTANTRYWFGLHWAGDLDYIRDEVYFAYSTRQNFNPAQESEFGLFNNWSAPTGEDRGFRLLGDGGDGEPPVPAIGPTGMILLIGLLMLGSAFYFRRMRQTS